jgi:hypothetical protein
MQRSPGVVALVLTLAIASCRSEEQAPPRLRLDAPPAAPEPPAPPLDPEAQAEQDLVDKAGAVLRCFHEDMKERARSPELSEFQRNLFTDLFVVDRTFQDPARLAGSAAAICASVSEEYRRLFKATAAQRKRARSNVPGAFPATIDADPEFIRAADAPSTRHILDHAEITRAAMNELVGARGRATSEVLAYAARATATDRWEDLRYFAFSAEDAPAGQPRLSASALAEGAFVAELRSSVAYVVRKANIGYFSNALLQLGAVCHAVQDLAIHGGITRRQDAALALRGHRDPAATREAKRLTKEVLLVIRRALGEQVWTKLVTWQPPNSYDPSTAQGIFLAKEQGAGAPLAPATLARYWARGRATSAHAEPGAAARVARWEVAGLLGALTQELASQTRAAPGRHTR